jgi:hypothetical protein
MWSIDGSYLNSPCTDDNIGRLWNGPSGNQGCYRAKTFVRRSIRARTLSKKVSSSGKSKTCADDPAYCYWLGQEVSGVSGFLLPPGTATDPRTNTTADGRRSTLDLKSNYNRFYVSKYSTIEHPVYVEFERKKISSVGIGFGITTNTTIDSIKVDIDAVHNYMACIYMSTDGIRIYHPDDKSVRTFRSNPSTASPKIGDTIRLAYNPKTLSLYLGINSYWYWPSGTTGWQKNKLFSIC